MVVHAEREVLHRINEAAEGELRSTAVVSKCGALQIGECAAGREQLLFEIVAAFERDLRLAQDGQAGRIGLRGRRVVSEAEKCAAHAQRSRAGIAEIELKAGERLDVGVLRCGR